MAETVVSGEGNAQRHLVRGASWMVAMRWTIRLTGLLNTIILARLLTPADYGVVAIATLVLGTIEVLGDAGQANAIIRHPNPTPEHYNAAWTISLIFGFGLALMVLAAAPVTVIYFHEPRAKLVLEILALRTALSGFQNIGTVNFQRNLQFNKRFKLNAGGTAVQSVVVVTSAFLLRNYWALVIAILSKQVATVVLSYVMDPYRPRLSISKIPELFSFSFWVLFRNIGTYIQNQVDQFAVGGFAGAAAMGRYNVGRDLAASPVAEASYPIFTALFPVLARISHDPSARRDLMHSVLYSSALICTSTAVGVAMVSNDMVDLVLGPKWSAVKPLVPWLALYYGIGALTASVYVAFEAAGAARSSARLQWLRVLGLSAVVFPAAYYFRDLKAVAVANFLVEVAITPTLFGALAKLLDMRMLDFVRLLWRPFAAGFTMAAVLHVVNGAIPFSGLPRLLVDVITGVTAFGASLMLLWFAVGRPEGPERWLHARVSELLTMATSPDQRLLKKSRGRD